MALRLATNQPEELRLLTTEGELTPSNFGSDQYKFRTSKGDLYVSEAVGGILHEFIAKQNVKTGDTVVITKREVSLGNGRKGIRWDLVRSAPAAGEQPDGTFAVPKAAPSDLEERLQESIQRAQAQRAQTAVAPPAAVSAWTDALVAQTAVLYDAYVLALEQAQAKHGGFVRPDDVRSLLTTIYINSTKNGASNGRAA